MKKICALLFFSLLLHQLFAQAVEKYARVSVHLGEQTPAQLSALGLETDHGLWAGTKFWIAEVSEAELQLLQNAGFGVKVLIPDVMAYYLGHQEEDLTRQRSNDCAAATSPWPVPANYQPGSMGGYPTLSETEAILDEMRAKFPQLITAKAPISTTLQTWEGNPVWYVRMSDNADSDEAEPEVLYTALHHAREPNGLSQMLYFMWFLLENYQNPEYPELKYLLDNTELYFIPCVNPDGYLFNQQIAPQGGGMWRKNRRDNGNGTDGVDLNRNYGFSWGLNNSGSSPNPQSDVYRGPSAFSEPETQMIRDFAQAHEFVFAQHYHTSGNLFIYPWAYNNTLADSNFYYFGRLFTRDNNYRYGTAGQTVGYSVNGDSNDWLYSESGTFVFTPEVGPTFWPAPDQIIPLNQSTMWMNLSMALSALHFGVLSSTGPENIIGLNSTLPIEVTRYGLLDGDFTLTVTPVSANVLSPAFSQTFAVEKFKPRTFEYPLQVSPSVLSGDIIRLEITLSNGSYSKSTIVEKVFLVGNGTVLVSDDFATADNWNTAEGTWDADTDHFFSAPSSLGDSPGGFYEADAFNTIILKNPILIPQQAAKATLQYWARWQTEPVYDFVQVMAVFESGNEVPLCGLFTKPSQNQLVKDQPVYDGFQSAWVAESIDLGAYAGLPIRIAFRLRADNGAEQDGFNVDDIRVSYFAGGLVHTQDLDGQDFRVQVQPNPADAYTEISWTGFAGSEKIQLRLNDILGKTVLDIEQPAAAGKYRIATAHLSPGVYTWQVVDKTQARTLSGKLLIH
ncbi:MAG: immune inhibitor A [Chitinophagales bacterium]|nr:immune inhibitor A [Chitinophagales bacterium]